jgi:hypothetical protein
LARRARAHRPARSSSPALRAGPGLVLRTPCNAAGGGALRVETLASDG